MDIQGNMNLSSPVSSRPETALPRSKSFNRHLPPSSHCFPDSDNTQNFETRIGSIIQMKNTNAMLNSSVMEAWINETLKDAEHLEIPGIIMKPVHKPPMNRYKIDKLWLHS